MISPLPEGAQVLRLWNDFSVEESKFQRNWEILASRNDCCLSFYGSCISPKLEFFVDKTKLFKIKTISEERSFLEVLRREIRYVISRR